MAEKSRIQLEWEERNPPESRPVVGPLRLALVFCLCSPNALVVGEYGGHCIQPMPTCAILHACAQKPYKGRHVCDDFAEPRSRPVMGAAGDSRVARETNGAGEGGEAEDANTALPKRENKDKKVENEEPVIIVNVPTSDEPQVC